MSRHFAFFPRKYPLILHTQHTRWRKQAKLLGLSKEARARLEWIIWYREHNTNVSLTCRHFHIHPKTFRRWRNRFDQQNLRLLESRSKAPKRKRKRAITPKEELRVIALRKQHMRWGKKKLQRIYINTYNEHISQWKIEYTIREYKLYPNPKKAAQTAKKRRGAKEKKRITELEKKVMRGYLVQLDAIVIYWNGLKRYILTAIDTATRLAYAHMYVNKSSASAADFLERFHALMSSEIEHGQTDEGSEFAGQFETACADLNVFHVFSRVKTPNDNAYIERFNRTIQEEFIRDGNFHTDPEVFNTMVAEWLIEYNFKRPHQSLGYMTPAEAVEKSAKVVPMWSALTYVCIMPETFWTK